VHIGIVIPTFNERENLPILLERLLSSLTPIFETSIVIVDDNSPDGTGEIAERYASQHSGITVVHRAKPMGLGSAILTGLRKLREIKVKVTVQMDADLSHRPEDIPQLIEGIKEGHNVAVGSRYIEGGRIVGWGFWRKAVSRTANFLAHLVLGIKIRDVTTGFKAYDETAVNILLNSHIESSGFSFQVESLYILSKKGLRICEKPITFVNRERGYSKLGLRDFIKFLTSILSLRARGVS